MGTGANSRRKAQPTLRTHLDGKIGAALAIQRLGRLLAGEITYGRAQLRHEDGLSRSSSQVHGHSPLVAWSLISVPSGATMCRPEPLPIQAPLEQQRGWGQVRWCMWLRSSRSHVVDVGAYEDNAHIAVVLANRNVNVANLPRVQPVQDRHCTTATQRDTCAAISHGAAQWTPNGGA